MITFRARMYNVTSGEYCDNTPTEYSFAQYYGYTGSESGGPDVMLGQDGRTLTNIPDTRFSHQRGTNVGTRFEYYAKKYFDENSSWPTLRLLTSNDIGVYYLEWVHSAPNGFYVKSPSDYSRWDYVFQWTDSFNAEYTDDRKYNLYFSAVFTSAVSISDLIVQTSIKYSGAFRYNSTTGGIDTLVGVNTINASVGNESLYSYNINEYYGRVDNREYYKTANGQCIAFFKYQAGGWCVPMTMVPFVAASENTVGSALIGWDGRFTGNTGGVSNTFYYNGLFWGYRDANALMSPSSYTTSLEVFTFKGGDFLAYLENIIDVADITVSNNAEFLYYYLQGRFTSVEPPSDVDPDDIPPEDEPPEPIDPDNPDPYYDPTSDPDSPDYDPTKDPESPQYDPTNPSTPHRPPSAEAGGEPPVKPPVDPVTPPPTPPSHALNSRFVTLYTPSLSQLNDLADYLWSPAWSVDGFKKILANPMDCILGLMIFPALAAPVGSKEVHVGNLSTGVTMSYIDNQYVELNCGSFEITEYYGSYLDYDPYTKIEIYLPYIGSHTLSADDVMSKTIQLKYMIDLLSGTCVAFLVVDGTTLYTFTGSCATSIPVAGNDWSKMLNSILRVAGAAAATIVSGGTAAPAAADAATSLFVSSHKERIRHGGSVESSAGLMSIQTPYLIITRPRQALPIGQNSFQGYPSFMTESLGSLTGYTEIESCHLEHIPCTAEELEEIERLLKGGVLF